MLNQNIKELEKIPLADGRFLKLDHPLIMGILNVTPDSFSDGGKYDKVESAVARGEEIIDEGADIIDIGGESTRPGSVPVTLDDELKRVIPTIRKIRQISSIPISIDTTKAQVARQAVDAGASIINDISALKFDPDMIDVVSESHSPVILMHMLGEPETMQHDPFYKDCINEIMQFFSERMHYCLNHGISKHQIILDPGIGFGKRLTDNLAIISKISEFRTFGCPVMIGTSRKSFIGMITGDEKHPGKRIGGSIVAALKSIANGADIIRVHDVAETIEAIRISEAFERGT
jgi:dihydropteroate synthase